MRARGKSNRHEKPEQPNSCTTSLGRALQGSFCSPAQTEHSLGPHCLWQSPCSALGTSFHLADLELRLCLLRENSSSLSGVPSWGWTLQRRGLGGFLIVRDSVEGASWTSQGSPATPPDVRTSLVLLSDCKVTLPVLWGKEWHRTKAGFRVWAESHVGRFWLQR